MMWLDMLRTPMAAPETPALKAMRLAILWSAIGLAIAICALQPLRAVLGAGAGGALAGLVLALATGFGGSAGGAAVDDAGADAADATDAADAAARADVLVDPG